jgi:hypothetical protein
MDTGLKIAGIAKHTGLALLCALFLAGSAIAAVAPRGLAQAEAGDLRLTEGIGYEVSGMAVPPGDEALILQARLASGGGLINLPIRWKLSRLGIGGEVVAEGTSAAFAAPVRAGDYRVEIEYGFARIVQEVDLPEAAQVTVTFILDVGGLRILSKIDALTLPYGSAMTHAVYAASGPDKGRLLTRATLPGDLLRLPAGFYRIESTLGPGNATAETQVEVKAGILSTVEIGHQAGVAQFNTPVGDGAWTVRDIAGRVVARVTEAVSELILEPGTYRVEQGVRSTAFTVVPGQSVGVVLPE